VDAPALPLIYDEPFEDRWVRGDRHPRRLARWLLRRNRPSGYRHLARQLRTGLERAGLPFRFNAFSYCDRHPDVTAGVLGNNALLERWQPRGPAVYGPCMLDHPLDRIDLFDRFNARLYLVPSEWVRRMFEPYFGERVQTWPIGIDLEAWRDFAGEAKSLDFLVYEKFIWEKDARRATLLAPLLEELRARGFSFHVLHSGRYTLAEYRELLRRARRMVFLCEHETQGQACQQALACNVPVFAWDQGWWLDPKATRYVGRPVPASSVPYFSNACGMRFRDLQEFVAGLPAFWEGRFEPRPFVGEHLELVDSARRYVEIVRGAGA